MFSTYSGNEINSILEARVGHTVIDPRVLQFVSKKVGSSSGDARKALELASSAVQLRLREIDEMDSQKTRELDSTVGPLVGMKHVVKASREEATNWKDRIDGLPLTGKMMLCVFTTLTQANVCTTTVGQLKNFVTDCMSSRGSEEEMLGYEDFLAVLGTLVDFGLLRASSNANPDEILDTSRMISDVYNEPIHLEKQPEDIEKSLSRELKQAFFQNLRERAIKEKGRFVNQ